MNEIEGPEAWWSPSFGHWVAICLIFAIFPLLWKLILYSGYVFV